MVKTYEQLAQSAYEAFVKAACAAQAAPAPDWRELHTEVQACWEAVARQLWAELAMAH